MLTDKSTIQQVLGGLIKHPQYLSEVDKYLLTIEDFSNRFEKYIFTAIQGLYYNNVENITIVDIDNYLSSNDVAHKTFEQQNGIEYLQDIIEFSSIENFDYYYSKLKKLNLLRDLKKQGIDISDFYEEDLTNPRAKEINGNFESLEASDIVNEIKKKLLKLESAYAKSEEVIVESVADDIENFIESLKETIEVGKPIQGEIYNYIINGAEPGALTIRSGSSGLGKTRQAVGDACCLAYPTYYDWSTNKWIESGSNDKVLFIVTEQTFKQVKKMILAYLTGINESKFKYGQFTNHEWAVIKQAESIIKKFEENFTLIKVPNPTIELIKTLVRENCLIRNIEHVFYDYIFIGPALLKEFHGFNLRDDEILLMFSTALKDLAVELNVSMMTSTQVNANSDDNKHIRNEASLAGGRATINKADNGAIMARPVKEELDLLAPLTSKYGVPNLVTDIFKVRSGEWTQVRIWSIIDLGIMRKKDLFLTDARLDPIENFYQSDMYVPDNWEEKEHIEIKKMIEDLNEGIILQ